MNYQTHKDKKIKDLCNKVKLNDKKLPFREQIYCLDHSSLLSSVRLGSARLSLSAHDLWVSQEKNGRNSSRLKSANNESSVGVMDGAHPGTFVCALRLPASIVKETLLNMQS